MNNSCKIFKVGTFTKEDFVPFLLVFIFLILRFIVANKKTFSTDFSYFFIFGIMLVIIYIINLIINSGKKMYISKNEINIGRRYHFSKKKVDKVKMRKYTFDKKINFDEIDKLRFYNTKNNFFKKYKKTTLEIKTFDNKLYYMKMPDIYRGKIIQNLRKFDNFKKLNPILTDF